MARQPSKHEAALLDKLVESDLPSPAIEYLFAKEVGRAFRFDFAWPEHDPPIAVETEGGTWNRGRHVRGRGFEKDAEKYNQAALLGWVVLRVTGAMIRDGRAMAYLGAALNSRSRDDIQAAVRMINNPNPVAQIEKAYARAVSNMPLTVAEKRQAFMDSVLAARRRAT